MIPVLPATLAPPAPFPLVLAQAREEEFVAPGVRRATYRLTTSDGPLAISVVAIDPHEPSVRIDSVVANDRMISRGETISSMAHRTGAVAGVNADYFDIGNTNQPLNLVVRAGVLERTPSRRIVLAIHRDGAATFERASFTGTASYGAATVPLTSVNEWPPQGGVGLLTPAYGVLSAAPGVQVAALVPLAAAHRDGDVAGSYRVASVDPAALLGADPASATVAGPLLAFGPAALARAPLPAVGDTVTLAASLTPPLDDLTCAVGGGPRLLAGGATTDDPNAPAPEERDRRFPVSGAGTTATGGLLLASVDGRRPELSIGLTRPQFAALWLGLGATDAMAFDSGGSSELVARVLGDATASVLGSPSDGEERAVADGLFVYSDAPEGAASRLVVRPREIVALADVEVPLALALADAAGHGLGAVHAPGGDRVRSGAASHVAIVRAAGLSATVPIDVVAAPTTLAIASDERDVEPGDTVRLRALAFDARGRAIALGDRVRWTATAGRFVAPGVLRAGDRDARVVATVGGVSARSDVAVGSHVVSLAAFAASRAAAWHFASAPAGGRGAAGVSPDEVLHLDYDFSQNERAAYADASLAIPGAPFRFAVDVFGDGGGAALRAAFVNRYGERRALTLASAVTWRGWQTLTIALPDDLNPPVRLVSLYAVDGIATPPVHARGTLAFRNATAVVAGTP